MKGLGRGVGVLFSTDEDDDLYFECKVENIITNKYQPRTYFDESELQELADSIEEHGILQPLVVRRLEEDDSYELVAGERRFRASKMIGLSTVPVIVRDISDENTLLELALIENIQRTDLNPVEEAEAYHNLIEKFSYTQEQAAKRLGKSRSAVANILRLLNLPDFIKSDLVEGALSEGHARALLRLADNIEAIRDIRNQIIDKKLSVRQTEQLVKKIIESPQSQSAKKKRSENEIPQSYCKTLINQLTGALHSKVSIQQKGAKGKIEINYKSQDDLERLISIMLKDE